MARPEPVLTYEDYLHFPDEQRWELLDGEAYMSPAPTSTVEIHRLDEDHYPDPDVHAPPDPVSPAPLPTLSIVLERLFTSD